MKNIWTVMKKELKRFFTDKRMLLSLILPGLLIFIVYSSMGSLFSSIGQVDKTYEYQVNVVNEPVDNYTKAFENENYRLVINKIDASEIDNVKKDIQEKKTDLLIVYPSNLANEEIPGTNKNIEVYFNSAKNESSTIYSYFYQALSVGSVKDVTYNYVINSSANTNYNLATKEDSSKLILTMLMPYLLMMLLFSGCMAICTESIAGEKERGTIATLLVTPIKRSEFALGKIFALSTTALVSALSSFLGVLLSLPNMLNGMNGDGGFTISMYGPGEYILILLLLVVCVIFFTSLLAIVSAFAKSVKEAGQLSVPLMIIVTIVGISSIITQGNAPTNFVLYFIPVYNIVVSLISIFSLEINVLNLTIAIVSNVVYISLAIVILTRLFNSERVMFNK